jgi:hypothetical protein
MIREMVKRGNVERNLYIHNSRCRARVSALALSKTSAKSWYSSRTEERSTGEESDVKVDRAKMSFRLSVNSCVPGNLQAQTYATALTREMSTFEMTFAIGFGFGLSSWMSESELSENGCGSISSEMVAHVDGLESDMGFSLFVVGKVILLNTQSINRL